MGRRQEGGEGRCQKSPALFSWGFSSFLIFFSLLPIDAPSEATRHGADAGGQQRALLEPAPSSHNPAPTLQIFALGGEKFGWPHPPLHLIPSHEHRHRAATRARCSEGSGAYKLANFKQQQLPAGLPPPLKPPFPSGNCGVIAAPAACVADTSVFFL